MKTMTKFTIDHHEEMNLGLSVPFKTVDILVPWYISKLGV